LLHGAPGLCTVTLYEVKKRSSNVRKATDKPLIKVSETKKHLQLYTSGWHRLIARSGYLGLVLQNN